MGTQSWRKRRRGGREVRARIVLITSRGWKLREGYKPCGIWVRAELFYRLCLASPVSLFCTKATGIKLGEGKAVEVNFEGGDGYDMPGLSFSSSADKPSSLQNVPPNATAASTKPSPKPRALPSPSKARIMAAKAPTSVQSCELVGMNERRRATAKLYLAA